MTLKNSGESSLFDCVTDTVAWIRFTDTLSSLFRDPTFHSPKETRVIVVVVGSNILNQARWYSNTTQFTHHLAPSKMHVFHFLLHCSLLVLLQSPASAYSDSLSKNAIQTPLGLDPNKYLRCHNIVHRLYFFMDTNADGEIGDEEVKQSDLSALGITNQDRAHIIEGCYFIAEMSVEDVQLYFDRCARMNQYLAHVNLLDGQDIFERFMDPASDSIMDQMLISKADRVQLRRKLFKSILRADRVAILARTKRLENQGLIPIISELADSSLTVRLPSVERASGYKVQYCEVDDGKSSEQPLIDVCGFAWSAVYPTAGVHVVRLYGLKPKRHYQIRVRVFFCDGASVVGKTTKVKTLRRSAPSKVVRGKGGKGGKGGMAAAAASAAAVAARSFVHLPHPTIKRISASRDTILLNWGGGCRVDSNTMRAMKKNTSSEQVCVADSPTNEAAHLGTEAAGGAGAMPITWEVKYDRDEGMGWKGSWQTAGCVEARRVDNMNDDPFSCFVNNLKEGRRYKFAVFGKLNTTLGDIEVMSKISR